MISVTRNLSLEFKTVPYVDKTFKSNIWNNLLKNDDGFKMVKKDNPPNFGLKMVKTGNIQIFPMMVGDLPVQ